MRACPTLALLGPNRLVGKMCAIVDRGRFQLLVLGRSMGTGVALDMVERGQQFRGLLLQSPFSTYSDAVGEIIATVVSRWVVLGMSGGDTLDNVKNIRGAYVRACIHVFLRALHVRCWAGG